jgi:monoamine oxidase
MENILIVGAGAAGLGAANCLVEQNLRVTLLEARERAGGRIHTATSTTGDLPIELGAEFVHGAKTDLWDLIRSAGLQTHEVPDTTTGAGTRSREAPTVTLLLA